VFVFNILIIEVSVRMIARMFAHVAGIPVEETALSLAPVVLAVAGVLGARLRSTRLRNQRRLSTRTRRPQRTVKSA
jgi:predicted alpha/beta-hydrolase family hydrolase